MEANELPVTDRTRLRRLPERGTHELAVIEAILDDATICHVGTVAGGSPVVLPMVFGHVGRRLYLHGSRAAGTLREFARGVDACVTVTIVDGLVLARSAFHHSMNYRCAVLFGRLTTVDEPTEKTAALRAVVNHVLPGRWDDTRPPTDRELRATLVLALDIDEGSAKVRTGGPLDEPGDLALPYWAGVLPLGSVPTGAAIPEPDLAGETGVPAYVAGWVPASSSSS